MKDCSNTYWIHTISVLGELFCSAEDLFSIEKKLSPNSSLCINDNSIKNFVIKNFNSDGIIETINFDNKKKYWVNTSDFFNFIIKRKTYLNTIKLKSPEQMNIFKYISWEAFSKQASKIEDLVITIAELNKDNLACLKKTEQILMRFDYLLKLNKKN